MGAEEVKAEGRAVEKVKERERERGRGREIWRTGAAATTEVVATTVMEKEGGREGEREGGREGD